MLTEKSIQMQNMKLAKAFSNGWVDMTNMRTKKEDKEGDVAKQNRFLKLLRTLLGS